MRNIAMMSVTEIRKALIEDYGYAEESLVGINKAKLQLTLRRHDENDSRASNVFAEVQMEPANVAPVTTDTDTTVTSTVTATPRMGDAGWEDFVLGHLEEHEMDTKGEKKYPKANGLRRIAQKLLGDIVESGPVREYISHEVNGPARASIVYEIKIRWKIGIPEYLDINNFEYEVRTFREIADAWKGNTPEVFAIHSAATASSRAEGRALRKALGLSTLVAEELENNPQYMEEIQATDDSILPNQKAVIDSLCTRLQVSPNKITNYLFPEKITAAELTRETAAVVIKTLNAYNTKGKDSKDIPEQVKAH